MSDMLTHWAVFEDCRRLVLADATFDPVLANILHEQVEYARLGTVTRSGNRFMSPILAEGRERWDDPAARPEWSRRIAFALGGLPHQAIDNLIKPHRIAVVEAEQASADPMADVHRWLYAYQDAYVFKRVFLDGKDGPFNRFLLADNTSPPGRALEEFARSLVFRALQGLHTLKPDQGASIDWIDGVFSSIQEITVDIQRLVDAANRPDPTLTEKFQITTVFYVETDPTVLLARKLQNGEEASQDELEAALAPNANAGIYGQALQLGTLYLRSGSDFWAGRVGSLDTPNYDTSDYKKRRAATGQSAT